MKELSGLDSTHLFLFLIFVVPGFVSMHVYGLLRSRDKISLKDNIFEAIAFSLVNITLMIWAVFPLLDTSEKGLFNTSPALYYVLFLTVLLVTPSILAIILFKFLNFLADKNYILLRAQNAWDDFFLRREPCWVIVHLDDGRRIGGWYGDDSYASLYPHSGHIYLEELWMFDAQGNFSEKITGSRGIILRPEDYSMIEFFESNGADG